MSKYFSYVKKLSDLVCNEIMKMDSGEINILDIGCGPSNMWENISNKLTADIRKRIKLTMFDAEVSLLANLNLGFNQISKVKGFAPTDLAKFKDDQFNFILCFNVIEHISKSNGYLLLYQMDRISSQSKMIYTPNGFVYNPPVKIMSTIVILVDGLKKNLNILVTKFP